MLIANVVYNTDVCIGGVPYKGKDENGSQYEESRSIYTDRSQDHSSHFFLPKFSKFEKKKK